MNSQTISQFSVVRLKDSPKPRIALVHLFWEDRGGHSQMEVRYLMPLSNVPQSVLKKTTLSKSTVGVHALVETAEVADVSVMSILDVVDMTLFSCTHLYTSTTASLTSFLDGSSVASRSLVHSTRLQRLHNSNQCHIDGSIQDPFADCVQRLQFACDQLQLSSIPKQLIGREEERRQIYRTLRTDIENGHGSPIYISGLPGMGKTATVKEILETLQNEMSFRWIEVNGLHMPKPELSYSILWKALSSFTNKSFNPKKARECLDALFGTADPARPVLVLLLDEMDFMLQVEILS
jgi:hypothetical protein